ncbi:MAG: DUF3794 domain-containing protein [Lachnospiraceae bacterium]
MELVYDSIHMEQKKWEAMTQFTVEEDIELPSQNADMLELLLEDVQCFVEETKVAREQVVVKGAIKYQVLYATANETGMDRIQASIPFEEVIHAKGAVPGDMPVVKAVVEDFHISRINPRKIELQSIVMIFARMCEEKTQGCPADLRLSKEKESVETYIDRQEIYQLKQKKQDILRIKEEIELQTGYQPIGKLLWHSVALRELEARPMDGKISVSGEFECFFIYETTGVKASVKTLSKKVPFQKLLDSSACDSDRYVNVLPTQTQTSVEVKEDYDGEDRIFFMEASMDMNIHIYATSEVQVLKDAYSTNQELLLEKEKLQIPTLILSGTGKTKIKESKRVRDTSPKIMQHIYTSAVLFPEKEEWDEGNLQLMGGVQVQTLYATAETQMPYGVLQAMIPYSFTMEARNVAATDHCNISVEPYIEKVEAIVRESEEVEWRVVLSFAALAVGEKSIESVSNVIAQDLDLEAYAAIPSMSVCFVDETMPLWEIGKAHYMAVSDIRKINEINTDEMRERKQVLLVKGSYEDGKNIDV